MYHVARNMTLAHDKRDVLRVICTRLRSGHLSTHAGDGSQRYEEAVKTLELHLRIRLLLLLTEPGIAHGKKRGNF